MNGLIYKQQAIDAVIKWFGCEPSDIGAFENIIEKLPSAQPEIIRCKECEDYQTDWETSYPNEHYCAVMDKMMPEDGFCSNAERREEGE